MSSSSWSHSAIVGLLDKMKSQDSDFRFMALNDLMAELNNDSYLPMDEATESATVRHVLELMNDSNGEVKNMAVRCLGILVPRVRDKQMQFIIDHLVEYTSSRQEELRDIASLALKTVTSQMPTRPNFASTATSKLAPKLIQQISDASASQELLIDSLDILAEVITKFAPAVAQNLQLQKTILNSVVPIMAHSRAAVRKRSLAVLGALGSCATSDIFTQLSVHVSHDLQSGSLEQCKTAIQLIAIFARTSPRRLGRRLPEFMPQVIDATAKDDDEVREVSLQAIEAILVRCPAEVTPFVNSSIQAASALIKHDPNYAGGDDSDEEMGDADSGAVDPDDQLEEDDDDDFIDDDYSDDDDMSWKVRRAAAKVLNAAIVSRPEMLAQNASSVAPILVSRFSEREESVRLEVLDTFLALLKQMQLYGGSPQATEVMGSQAAAVVGALKRKRQDAESDSLEGSPRGQLQVLVPRITRALSKEIVSKSIPTRHKSFVVLRELVVVLHGGLDDQIGTLLGQTDRALKGADATSGAGSNLKAEILGLFRVLFLTHAAKSFEAQLPQLVPILAGAVGDKLHRNCTEALLTCSQLVVVLRPLVSGASKPGQYRPFVLQIYTAVIARLNRVDSDQEIKERGIACLGVLLAHAGDDLAQQRAESFAVLASRLQNEVTRFATVKVIAQIAVSPICVGTDVEAFLQSCIGEVASLLRKSNRQLKLAAFDCLAALLSRSTASGELSVEHSNAILAEVQPLVNQDMDMNLLPLILRNVNLILRNSSSARESVQESLLPQVYSIMRLPLAQGPTMDSMLEFFRVYVAADPQIASRTTEELFDALDKAKSSTSGTHVYSTVARCVGAVSTVSTEASASVANRATQTLEAKTDKDADVYFSLLLLGELGRFNDFSTRSGLFERVLQFYGADSEEVKIAAAFAIGNMAVGALPVFLPVIEQHIRSPAEGKDSKRLLSLHALKELITHGSSEQLALVAEQLWPVLFEACDTKEEGVRSIGAECLARLTHIDPAKYLALLQERLRSTSASVRAIVVAAVRFTLSTESSVVYDELLAPVLVDFLGLLKDPELSVRRNAMFALNSAAHNKPYLIRDHLAVLLPLLYGETHVKAELLRKVSMGPFLVVTDDGLDLRKNAYETMYQLLDTCWSRIKMDEYLDRVIAGLSDSDDGIKTLCYLMVIKVVELRSSALTSTLAGRLEDLADPIAATLKTKLKDQATKQEIEKQAELQRFIYKTLVTVTRALGGGTGSGSGAGGAAAGGVISQATTPKFYNVVSEAKSASTSTPLAGTNTTPGQLWREMEMAAASSTV
ncbi:TIP120-domain-containing protein [Testicularia cyperi]|uniref:TIP120-domain-containing protein n=1 Tax=Testicularia cyperi TaxID=1882483 RepID=A0A317XIY6_9BASI|nr:TIP120-domain-containing protein [Testicularia cyperi]